MRSMITQFRALLEADRKKAMVLGGLLCLLSIVVFKMVARLGPSAGRAEPGVEGIAGAGVTDVASAGQTAVSRTLANVDAASRSFVEVPAPPPLSRDLFALDESHFPRPVQKEKSDGPGTLSSDRGVQPASENADEVRARLVAQVHADAAGLRLGSVVVGQTPAAVFVMPDGKRLVVRPGQPIAGFVVTHVASDGVTIERDSVSVRLDIARPDR